MSLVRLWDATLGRGMTRRLMKWILPDLIWNQQIYGTVLQKYVNGQTRWLDLGCGWRLLGKDLEPIEDSLVAAAKSVVGCDMDFQSVLKHRNIKRLVLGSADVLPFEEGSFDLVTCNMVVEHFSDPGKAFSEMSRVLAPGGYLIVHTPNLLNYAVFLNHTVMRWIPRKSVLALIQWADKRKEDDIFVTFYRANTARRLARVCGQFGLREESHRLLTPPRPFLSFFAPLALIQILLMRMTMSRYFRRFGATILMVLKSDERSRQRSNSGAARDVRLTSV